jgi:nucleoside-diphosphate-sugar epimerase
MSTFWEGKRVLVTGAGGFIGSQQVEALLEQGANVRAFVRYNSRADSGFLRLVPQELSGSLEVVAGDLREWQAIRQVVGGCEIVFHLGALLSIPYSYHHPFEVAETNFMGTLNILMACQYLGVKRLIHTSTSEVYGTARQLPIDVSHPLQGQSPYSASKIGADNRLACERLGWSPEFTLDQGLEHTIAWIRDHLDLYRAGTYEF